MLQLIGARTELHWSFCKSSIMGHKRFCIITIAWKIKSHATKLKEVVKHKHVRFIVCRSKPKTFHHCYYNLINNFPVSTSANKKIKKKHNVLLFEFSWSILVPVMYVMICKDCGEVQPDCIMNKMLPRETCSLLLSVSNTATTQQQVQVQTDY